MLHIRYQSRIGDAHGHGPLEAGRARLVAAPVSGPLRHQPGRRRRRSRNAVLKHPDELTADPGRRCCRPQWVEARMSSMGLPAVLSGGIEFETLQFSPADMALVDLAQFNESRIAVLLGVPPFLIGLPSGGDSMTYSNVIVAVRLPLAGRAATEGRPRSWPPCPAGCCPAGTTRRS